jgi:hypothetical protein
MHRRRADRDRVPAGARRRRVTDLEFRETHRVHERAAAAIIRARKPLAGPAPSSGHRAAAA